MPTALFSLETKITEHFAESVMHRLCIARTVMTNNLQTKWQIVHGKCEKIAHRPYVIKARPNVAAISAVGAVPPDVSKLTVRLLKSIAKDE